jgi:hypothetical protein
VVTATATPGGRVLARLAGPRRRIGRARRDALLFVRIGWFIARAPAAMERDDLPAFIGRLRRGGRPAASDPWSGRWRIVRLRNVWLRRWFRGHDTCYVRALVLYRFLDPGTHDIGFHVGIEPPRRTGDRLRGHAWVTCDGEVLEGPPELVTGAVREVPLHAAQR